jgi:hypothetical protein
MVNICTGGKFIVHFAVSWLRRPRSKQADYAFRRGKDMLQKRLFYMFSHIIVTLTITLPLRKGYGLALNNESVNFCGSAQFSGRAARRSNSEWTDAGGTGVLGPSGVIG